MPNETTTAKRVTCPSCNKKAKRVSTVTLEALLDDEFAQQFKMDGHSCCDSSGEGCTPVKENTGWRYCDSTDCDVVYFSEEGNTTFNKSQLRVPVGVKETAGGRPLCYCFGHSVASIKDELRTKGSSVALDDIRQKMKDPGCRCETENPSGSCCLGSVAKGIKTAQEELGMYDAAVALPGGTTKPPSHRGETIAKVGTVVSAIIASSCCWLPLVLLAVGVSGAGIASTMEAYRPLFMVVTFSFLAAVFYYTYRPKKLAAGGGHGCCATEEVEDCCSPAKGRFNMMTMNKVMLWGVTVMAVAFLLFPSYVGAFLGGDGSKVTANMNRSVFAIEGMTCEGCSSIAAKAIRNAPGVLAVEVDYGKGEAVVGTEKCCPVPKDEIVTMLKKAGYGGIFVEESQRKKVSSTAEATR